jgi:cyanophycinase-like exopeptidase
MTFGRIAFLGSGETARAGGAILECLAGTLPRPLRIAILETPAGFEPNSPQVAGRVADFMRVRLRDYNPEVQVIPARKRGTPFSPDEPAVLASLLSANFIFMGPGSPTYAIRQLQGSLAWDLVRGRQRLGATLAFASAAAIAVGAWGLPVYEVYKVGEEIHSCPGLNLFSNFGLQLSFIPHWNNNEGGDDVDTSRCFVGLERFEVWSKSLPPENIIVGLDEHTGLIVDFEMCVCEVCGSSTVTLVREGKPIVHAAGAKFDLRELGEVSLPAPIGKGIAERAWEMLEHAPPFADEQPSAAVLALASERQQARRAKNWAESDRLREQIAALGWMVQDTEVGQQLVRQ